MTHSNPPNLLTPQIKAKSLSTKPVIITICVLAFLLLILVYSIHSVNTSQDDNRMFLDDSIENGEFWLVDGAGLAIRKNRKQQTSGVIGGTENSNKLYPATPSDTTSYVETDEQGREFIRNPDGSISYVETDEQGRKFIRNPDGSITYINPEKKNEFVRNADGSISRIETDEQGREFIRNPDGTTSYIETDEQGRKFVRNPDGSVTYINPDSKDEFVRNSDGTVSYVGIDEQGREFIRNPDGSISYIETDEQGRKFVRNPDGSISYVEDGEHARAKVINPDGTISYVTKTESGSIIENPDGTTTHIFKGEDGREAVLITGKPSKENEEFQTRDGITGDSNSGQDFATRTGGLSPEELEALRKKKLQNYLAALEAPVLAKQVATEEEITQQQDMGVSSSLNALNTLANMEMPPMPGSSAYDPAADKDKEDFFNRSKQDSTWLADSQRVEGYRYELKTGTVVPGVMTTSINSDLPGNVIAQVSQNIYDSATGRYLLVPQGTKLFGVFDSRVIFGQSRVLVAWNRIIFPDGSSMTLPAMPGTDKLGNAGFSDIVDNHFFRTFGSAGLMSLIVGGTGYALNMAGGDSNDENSLMSQMTVSLAQQIGQTSASLLEKNLNIKPTLEIRAGYQFNIVLTQDLAFETPYSPWRE